MTLSADKTLQCNSEQVVRKYSPRNSAYAPKSARNSSSTLSSADSFLVWWSSSHSSSTPRTPSPHSLRRDALKCRQEDASCGKSLHPGAFRSRSLSPILPPHPRSHHLSPSSCGRNRGALRPRPLDTDQANNFSNMLSTHLRNENLEGSPSRGLSKELPSIQTPSTTIPVSNKSLKHKAASNKEKKDGCFVKTDRKLYRSKSVFQYSFDTHQQTPIVVKSYDSIFKRQPRMFSFGKFAYAKTKSASPMVSSVSLNEDFRLSSYQATLLLLYKLQNGRFSARAMFENVELKGAKKILVEIIGYSLEVVFLDSDDVVSFDRSRSKCVRTLLSKNATSQKLPISACSYKYLQQKEDSFAVVLKRYRMTLPIYADTNTLEFAWNKQHNFLEVSGFIKGCSDVSVPLRAKSPEALAKPARKGSRSRRPVSAKTISETGKASIFSSINCCANNKNTDKRCMS